MLAIRPARREDHTAYVELFQELGVPDPVPDADAWTAQQAPTALFAEVDGKVAGYLFHETIGQTFYVRNVVSAPAFRRTGVGRALMESALALARSSGTAEWCLNVKEENVPAIRLYESLGLRKAYATVVVRLPWTLQVPVDGTAVVRVPEPSEDAAVERALRLMAGLVDHHRKMGRLLFAAFGAEGGAAVGLSSFNASFPGAFPFKARSVGVAGALLKAMAPHREKVPGDDWRATGVQLVLEDEERVAEELIQLGAECVLRLFHMSAKVPAA